MTTKLPCCGYEMSEHEHHPVYWNPYNKAMQCHACGHVYYPAPKPYDLPSEINNLNKKVDRILMKASEAVAVIDKIRSDIKEGVAELLKKLDDLTSADAELSSELSDKLNSARDDAQALANIVDNAIPPVNEDPAPPVAPEPEPIREEKEASHGDPSP